MKREEILEKVIDLAHQYTPYTSSVKKCEITEESRFVADLGFDSLDDIELLIDIEHEFNIQYDEKKHGRINTIGEAVTKIEELLK